MCIYTHKDRFTLCIIVHILLYVCRCISPEQVGMQLFFEKGEFFYGEFRQNWNSSQRPPFPPGLGKCWLLVPLCCGIKPDMAAQKGWSPCGHASFEPWRLPVSRGTPPLHNPSHYKDLVCSCLSAGLVLTIWGNSTWKVQVSGLNQWWALRFCSWYEKGQQLRLLSSQVTGAISGFNGNLGW